jgi:hypothetical protein
MKDVEMASGDSITLKGGDRVTFLGTGGGFVVNFILYLS